MGAPIPFRTKKGETFSSWKAVVNGQTVELANSTCTKEDAEKALNALIPSSMASTEKKISSIGDLLKSTEKIAATDSLSSSDSKTSVSNDKPKPGEFRKEGLSELTSAKITKFRAIISNSIASGNVSLDRLLVSLFRDAVPIIPPEQYLLLSAGWELACEKYFVDGLPPPWFVILLGNIMVCTSLYENSKPKPIEESPKQDGTIGNPANRP